MGEGEKKREKGKGGRERRGSRGEGKVEGGGEKGEQRAEGGEGKKRGEGKGKEGEMGEGEMGEGKGRWKWEEAKGWGGGDDELVHDSSNGASDADWLRPVFAADTISDV